MKRFVIALAVLAIPATALAQGGSPAAAPPAAAGRGIDEAHFRAHRAEKLMRMDTDHDGRVSKAEFDAAMAMRKHGGHGDKFFARLDANHDGYLSSDELAVMADRTFQKLDTNHDGKLDASERQAAHHGHGDREASPTGL